MTDQNEARLPAGERPQGTSDAGLPESQRCLRLLSGKLFRHGPKQCETSEDNAATWTPGGALQTGEGIAGAVGDALENSAIQLQSAPHRGRIVIPFYFEMNIEHPDYTRDARGGYAIWRGEKMLLQTHTHVPEMAGTYMCFSDDEGQTWQHSRGFLMGYFEDGHLGHWSCEEPVVAELEDGRLLCYMRSTTGRILQSYGSDGGASWCKVTATDLAMSNSPCRLCRIPGSGDLLLVWNQMSADEIRRGYRRGRLSVAVSRDSGQTWENFRTLIQSPGVDTVTRVEPPPLSAMVRGGSGPDEILSELPDGFTHYHYHQVYFSEDGATAYVYILVSGPLGSREPIWRSFPTASLYE